MRGWGRNGNVKPKPGKKRGLFNIKDSLERTLLHLGFHMQSGLLVLNNNRCELSGETGWMYTHGTNDIWKISHH